MKKKTHKAKTKVRKVRKVRRNRPATRGSALPPSDNFWDDTPEMPKPPPPEKLKVSFVVRTPVFHDPKLETLSSEDQKTNGTPVEHLKDVAEAEQQRIKERLTRNNGNGGINSPPVSIIELHNLQGVEFVRKLDASHYKPVDWPRQATHRLVPTSWDNEGDRLRSPTLVLNKALSVCAEPLKRQPKRTALVVRKRLPKNRPVYMVKSEVEGKRGVLRFMVEAMRPVGIARIRRKLRDMTSKDCDLLYNQLIRAHLAKFRRKNNKLLQP